MGIFWQGDTARIEKRGEKLFGTYHRMREFFIILTIICLISIIITPQLRSTDESSTVHGTPSRMGATRVGGRHNVNLYLKEDMTMDTVPPPNGTPAISRLSDGDVLEFESSRPLHENLEVEGVTDEGKHGFKLFLRSIYTGNTECSMTVKVFDGDTEVASSSFTPEGMRDKNKTIFFRPESAPDSTYTFGKGNGIRLRINVSIADGPGPVIDRVVAVSYDSSNKDSRLSLFTEQIMEIAFDTCKDKAEKSDFEPNLPDDERYIEIEGEVLDIIGDYDVNGVEVIIRGPETARIFNGTAEMTAGEADEKISFAMRWDYPSGNPPGTYSVRVMVTDNSGNTFNSTGEFEMLSFGLRMSSEGYAGSGTPGGEVPFIIGIMNTGGEDDTVLLSAVASPDPWEVSLPEDVDLAAGSKENFELLVTVPRGARESDSCTVKVSAVSEGDGDVEAGLPEPLTVTARTKFIFTVELEDGAELNVENGKTAPFNFAVSNEGEEDSISITVPRPPPDWVLELKGDAVLESRGGTYPREYRLPLDREGSENVVIELTAPDYPVEENSKAALDIVFSSENESSMTITKNIVAITVVDHEIRPILTVDEEELTSGYDRMEKAFREVEFRVGIDNPGRRDIQVNPLVVGKDAAGWSVDLDPHTLVLASCEKECVRVSITPPDDAPANDEGVEFEFSAGVAGSETDRADAEKVTLTVLVEQYHSIDLKVKGGTDKTLKREGTSVVFELEVTNEGNGEDEIMIADCDRSNWMVEVSDYEEDFEAGEKRTIRVTVEAPAEVDRGEVKYIDIEAVGGGRERKKVTLTVNVEIGLKQRFDSMVGEMYFWVIIGLFTAVMVVIFKAHPFHKRKK